jgi:hypothetical protein
MKAMPSLRRREAMLRSGGWFHVLNIVKSHPDELDLHPTLKISAYDKKPGVRAMVSDEKAMLSKRPIVVAKKKKKGSTAPCPSPSSLNKIVLDTTNKLHAVVCGWPSFNKWTPPRKYLSKRSQCDFNFSIRKDRQAWLFPERRFTRFVNYVNETDRILLESCRTVIQKSKTISADILYQRLEILTKWLFVVGNADYKSMTCERRKSRTKGTPLGTLFKYRRILSMEVR